jgi:hypothetical protein
MQAGIREDLVCGTRVHLVHPILHAHTALSDQQFVRQKILGFLRSLQSLVLLPLSLFCEWTVVFCGLAELLEVGPHHIFFCGLAELLEVGPHETYYDKISEACTVVCLLLSFNNFPLMQSFFASCRGLWRVLVSPCLVTMSKEVLCSGPLRLVWHRSLSPSQSPLNFATG